MHSFCRVQCRSSEVAGVNHSQAKAALITTPEALATSFTPCFKEEIQTHPSVTQGAHSEPQAAWLDFRGDTSAHLGTQQALPMS